jgi:hypothetical protein
MGNGGKVTTDARGHAAHAMAIQQILLNGSLVVAGEGAPSGGATRIAVARFKAFTVTLQYAKFMMIRRKGGRAAS